MKYLGLSLLLAFSAVASAEPNAPAITGQYLEVRTCDVYTGPCFANSEAGFEGKEAILTWAVDEGAWKGVRLDGLTVIAAIRAHGTLDDIRADAGATRAVLLVDAKADAAQQHALADFAKAMAGILIDRVVAVRQAAIETTIGQCSNKGCAYVRADDLVEVSTRCLNGADHVCGNEQTYYPPLTRVDNANPAYTELARFDGDALGLKWKDVGSRGAFLATFAV